MKHYGDITKLHGYDLPPVDCITGGSPCQDLSVAGKRAGLAGERSGLFMEQVRIVKEMREHDRSTGRTGHLTRPRYMLWENVPGAFSSNKGEDFRAVLEEIAKVEESNAVIPGPPKGKWSHAGCIVGDGWSIAWRLHDAQFWGVPQRRKRIALVADFGGQSAPEVLFERKGLSGDFEQSRTTREETAGGAGKSTESASGAFNPWDSQSARVYSQDGVWHSLNANENGGQSRDSVFCLQGNGIDRADTAGCNGKGWREDVCYTLNTNSNASGRNSPLVYDARGNGDGQTVHTMTGDHENRVTDYTALCIGNGQMNQSVDDKAGALNWRTPSVVRRLTPLECERLQGYPDGWTDIGEWVDSKGKRHKDADSPRYKALGNSIALPFWFWLLRRISAQYIGPATLGSLFDGIGGFPLAWERCNGPGTAIFASEIEEFPIAVTKRHFPEDRIKERGREQDG